MHLASIYGINVGMAVYALCCIGGLLLFALRARDTTRMLGVLGISMFLIYLFIETVWSRSDYDTMTGPNGITVIWIMPILYIALHTGGLILVALAIAAKPRQETRRDVSTVADVADSSPGAEAGRS